MRRFMSSTRIPATLGGLALVLTLGACASGPSRLTAPDLGSEPAGRFTVTNSRAQLAGRVHYARGVKLRIEPGLGGVTPSEAVTLRHSPLAVPSGVSLRLLAEVDPPELQGTTLQATHIAMHRGKVYVSYNAQGPLFMGGVDVFNVVPPRGVPELISSALYPDTDVNAVDSKDGKLYLATATDNPEFATQAALEEVDLDGDLLTSVSRRVGLPSYAGTGVAVDGGLVFATSGDGPDGGVAAFDALTLEQLWRSEFADARAVTVDGGTTVTMSGQPCTLRMFDAAAAGPTATGSCCPGGANYPHAKSTVAIHQGLAFVAAGDEGTKVVRLADGVVTSVVPVPPVAGLAPELTVTNAVAVSGNLVYMANGGAGLWVARLRHDQLEVVGKIEFGDGPSVNFVAARGNLLFVATGTGGLRIVQVNHGNAF
jgi:putative pyrroloquinoline-quinone-binding quinoprotein